MVPSTPVAGAAHAGHGDMHMTSPAHPMQATRCSTPPCVNPAVSPSKTPTATSLHSQQQLLHHLQRVLQVTADDAQNDVWQLQQDMNRLGKQMAEHVVQAPPPHSGTSSMRTSVLVQGVDALLEGVRHT